MSDANVQQAAGSRQQGKIKDFTDLEAWKEAHKLALMIYKATKTFPEDERFGLTSQVRRAALSVSSNIAEGFGRRNAGEKIQFYSIAQASVSEAQSQLLLARDLNYGKEKEIKACFEQSVSVHKLPTSLIRSIR